MTPLVSAAVMAVPNSLEIEIKNKFSLRMQPHPKASTKLKRNTNRSLVKPHDQSSQARITPLSYPRFQSREAFRRGPKSGPAAIPGTPQLLFWGLLGSEDTPSNEN